MTYNITLYARAEGSSSGSMLDETVSRVRESAEPEIVASNLTSGAGWAAADLHFNSQPADQSTVRIEIHADSDIVREMIRQIKDQDPSGRVTQANAAIILTLIGDRVDWPIVRAVWSAVENRWSTVPYDDGSGFEVGIDALG